METLRETSRCNHAGARNAVGGRQAKLLTYQCDSGTIADNRSSCTWRCRGKTASGSHFVPAVAQLAENIGKKR